MFQEILRTAAAPRCRVLRGLAAGAVAVLLTACADSEAPVPQFELASVARNAVPVRAELAPTSRVLRKVHLGDELEILEERRGSVKVRTGDGVEGWTGRHALVTAETKRRMDWQKEQTADLAPQGTVHALDILNVHLDPARESETIYQLQPDEPADLLARRFVEGERSEGWFLVRLSTGHSGWVLDTRVYSGIPVEVAQYAEGRRIVAYFSLGDVEVPSLPEPKPIWLWVQSPGRNSPTDFDRIRVFRWSRRANAYQTIKLERGLRGYLPITMRPGNSEREAQFDVVVEKDGGYVKRTYEVRGLRVARLEETATKRRSFHVKEPPPVVEDVKPPSILERLRSWWDRVA